MDFKVLDEVSLFWGSAELCMFHHILYIDLQVSKMPNIELWIGSEIGLQYYSLGSAC